MNSKPKIKHEPRVVTAAHGMDRVFGCKFRARIVERHRDGWFGEVTEYRYVLERHLMTWDDWKTSRWFKSFEEARLRANRHLDRLGSPPSGEYV